MNVMRCRPGRLMLDGCKVMMTGFETIGIMADSHGDADSIAAAITLFQEMDCRQMVHLGDICDSVSFDHADKCVGLLRRHAVLAVKGNNDHAVVKNGESLKTGSISMETAAYLESLPLQIEISNALFVHSRPFAGTLGLSAMTGEIGKEEEAWFLKSYPGKVLFRGHGHSPRVTRISCSRNTQNSLVPGKKVSLGGKRGWVVTCGALYKGMCMTWDFKAGVIISHRIKP